MFKLISAVYLYALLPRAMENQDAGIFIVCGILLLIIAVIASLGNSFILYIVKRDPLKCFNKPTNIFNMSLTMVHLFVGALASPFAGVLNILRGQSFEISISSTVSKVEAVLVNFAVGAATLLLFAISIERSTAFILPHLNKKWLTLKRARNISLTATASCFVSNLLLFFPNSKTFFYFVYLHVFIFFPACGILASCAARLRNFKKQARVSVIDSGLPVARLFVHEARRRNSQLIYKLLVTVFSILLPVSMSLFLFYTVRIIEIRCEECLNRKWFWILSNVTLIFLFLISALNPLIMYTRISEYSRSIKHVFRK